MIEKLDLRRTLKHLYQPSAKQVTTVDVPPLNFLMIDGQGNPNTALSYQQAVEALYSVSYTLKFAIKKRNSIDYPVMPLEGLWWMDEMGSAYGELDFTADKSLWRWTMMMLQPEPVTAEQVTVAQAEAGRKKDLPALSQMRFESFTEGLAAQVMHIGPYSAEKPTIDRLHQFIADQGGHPCGRHHEIYLGDPRRTQPAKLRTVIRQPFRC